MPQAIATEADVEAELTGNQDERAEMRIEEVFDSLPIVLVRI